MHIIRIFIISRIHWKRKLWYQLWRISLIRREYWTILLFFQGTVYGVSGKGFADWNFVFGKQE